MSLNMQNNWNYKVLNQHHLEKAFQLSYSNRFDALTAQLTTDDDDYQRKCYTSMVESINHAASENIPPKPKQTLRSVTHDHPLFIAAQSKRDKAVKEASRRRTRAAAKEVIKRWSENWLGLQLSAHF